MKTVTASFGFLRSTSGQGKRFMSQHEGAKVFPSGEATEMPRTCKGWTNGGYFVCPSMSRALRARDVPCRVIAKQWGIVLALALPYALPRKPSSESTRTGTPRFSTTERHSAIGAICRQKCSWGADFRLASGDLHRLHGVICPLGTTRHTGNSSKSKGSPVGRNR